MENKSDRIDLLKYIVFNKLELKEGEFCYIGGIALEFLGIRKAHDIDLCMTPDAFKRVEKMNLIKSEKTDFLGVKRYDIGNEIEITLNNYQVMGVSDTEIIENQKYNIKYNNLTFIKPEFIYVTKLITKNSKAKNDLELIENYSLTISENKFDLDLIQKLYKTAGRNILRKRISYIFKDKIIKRLFK